LKLLSIFSVEARQESLGRKIRKSTRGVHFTMHAPVWPKFGIRS